MVPSAHEPDRRLPPFPWICALIIGGSILVYALQTWVLATWKPRTAEAALAITLRFGALYTPSVRDGEWWRVFSFVFTHGGLMHLVFNVLATTALGVPLERRIGTARFAQLSVVACLGSAAFVILFPRGTPLPTVGASGVVFGWAGALLPLLAREQKAELLKLLLLNAVISLLPGISWQGHLGGFVFGLACGVLLRADPIAFSSRTPMLAGLGAALSIWGAYRGG